MTKKLEINKQRLWNRLQELGSIGADRRGGVSRYAWTPEYKEACELLIKWMEEAGLTVRMDTVGNLFGKLEGQEDLPPVLSGSHLDTVPMGGKFDGAAGIMSILEVLTTMSERGYKPKRPVELVAFVNEEATQFLGGTFGSKAMTGMLPDDYAEITKDRNTGITMKQAMLDFGMGLEPDNFAGSVIKKGDYHAFIEVHIEQGRYLLDNNLPLAIVTAVAGIKQIYITLNGKADHVGGTAMDERQDTLTAAAAITMEVERIALSTGRSTRGSVGYLKSHPGEHNIIAEETIVPIDFREDDPVVFEQLYTDLIDFTEKECEKRGLTYSVRYTTNTEPAPSDPRLMDLFEEKANENGFPNVRMVSHPSHDAKNLSRLYPMGMIFLRGQNDGVSHSPEEYTTPEDLAAGTTVLLDSIVDLVEKDIIEEN